MTTQEKLLKFNNNKYFLKEFTFSDTKFVPENETQIELADSIIIAKDFCLIFQAKERKDINQDDDIKWFNNTILNKAKKQTKKTYKNLERLRLVNVKNDSGSDAVLNSNILERAVAIIVYSNKNISSFQSTNHTRSQTIGFIHILDLEDYFTIVKQLIMLTDVFLYFLHRENTIKNGYFKNEPECLTTYMEKIVTNFMVEQPHRLFKRINDSKYNVNYAISIFREELNIATQSSADGSLDEYLDYPDYRSLLQHLILLDWLELKQFLIVLDDVNFFVDTDISSKPFRIVNERLNCGFVITYIDTQNRLKWYNIMNTFMKFHCFEFDLDYCIGIAYTKNEKGDTRKEMIYDVRGDNGDVTTIKNHEMIRMNIRYPIIQKRKY
jgi:hypothetical protein